MSITSIPVTCWCAFSVQFFFNFFFKKTLVSIVGICLHADVAFADALTLLPFILKHSIVRIGVKAPLVHSSQPETVDSGEILACAKRTLALHEWQTAEVLQAASCWRQRLSTSLVPCSCILEHTNEVHVIGLKCKEIHTTIQKSGVGKMLTKAAFIRSKNSVKQ